MPFGLSTAPYLFTELTSPIGDLLRGAFKKTPFVSYFDGNLIIGSNYEECQKFLNITVLILLWLDFILNPKSLTISVMILKRMKTTQMKATRMKTTICRRRRNYIYL